MSAAGGWLPRWSRDGRELFYLSGDLHLMAMLPVRLAPSIVPGAPQPLFAVKRATEWVDAKSPTWDGWTSKRPPTARNSWRSCPGRRISSPDGGDKLPEQAGNGVRGVDR